MTGNSVTEVIDAEVVGPLDIESANRLDKRIRLLVSSINDSIDKLHDLVAEAKRGEVHVALGFRSWTEYVASVFKVQVRLDRDNRRELVGFLSGEGMSQRVIAEVVGTSVGTVNADIAGVQNRTPDEASDRAVSLPPVEITTRDGKTYRNPSATPPPPAEAKLPRRRPIPEAFFSANYDLSRAVGRVTRLSEDDRFIRNADVLQQYVSDLVRARSAIDAVIAKLDPDQLLRISDYMEAEASKKVAAAFEVVADA